MDMRTPEEKAWHDHMGRWGSDGWPIYKLESGKGWIWLEAFGVKGAPTVYKRKKDIEAAMIAFEGVLCDKAAGRL